METKYSKSLNALKAERALLLLHNRIEEINSVQKWASEARMSRRWLCKIMKQEYAKDPKTILREMRYKTIKNSLKEDLEMTGYCAALEAGLKDEKALYKFLSTHYDTSLTKLRKRILNGISLPRTSKNEIMILKKDNLLSNRIIISQTGDRQQ